MGKQIPAESAVSENDQRLRRNEKTVTTLSDTYRWNLENQNLRGERDYLQRQLDEALNKISNYDTEFEQLNQKHQSTQQQWN